MRPTSCCGKRYVQYGNLLNHHLQEHPHRSFDWALTIDEDARSAASEALRSTVTACVECGAALYAICHSAFKWCGADLCKHCYEKPDKKRKRDELNEASYVEDVCYLCDGDINGPKERDHVNPFEKQFQIAELIRDGEADRLHAELKRVKTVHAHCHYVKTCIEKGMCVHSIKDARNLRKIDDSEPFIKKWSERYEACLPSIIAAVRETVQKST